jgi:hypothetical protein
MPKYKVAHLHEQGQDMIIVPLDRAYDLKSFAEQNAFKDELQMRANAAGLRGTVVTVWPKGGRMGFIAPQPWHPFFRSTSIQFVMANLNRELSW